MHIKSGNDRIVMILPKQGFVLKIARFSFKKFKKLLSLVWEYLINEKMKKVVGEYGGLIEYLSVHSLHSIYENLRERRFYKKTKHPFFWPTWFSFCGIVNIQPYAHKVLEFKTETEKGIWFLQCQALTEMYCWESNHSWSCGNFCVDENGQARMLDYGAWSIGFLIEKYGDRLLKELRPDLNLSDNEIEKLQHESASSRERWQENRLDFLKFIRST